MDVEAQFDAVLDVFGRLDIEVRHEGLGGAGGGLCTIRGKRVLFVDLDADPATRLETSARALAGLAELEGLYISPVLRELIDRATT